MSCYFLYTVTPVVEVTLVPTGYALGHALSNVQQSSSLNQELILRSEKYLHQIPDFVSSSEIRRFPDLEKPNSDTSTRSSARLFRRSRKRGSRSHDLTVDGSRFHVRRQRLRTRATVGVGHRTLDSGRRKDDAAGQKFQLISVPRSSSSEALEKPLLYCDLCRVKLNAVQQAKQHFEGKTHAKKVKLAQMCSKNDNCSKTSDKAGTAEAVATPSSSGNELQAANTPPGITSPEIYCSICGISFNSDKQSKQHYRGKLHAKKQRLANHLSRCAARRRSRAVIQEEGRQRLHRMDSKENHTPMSETNNCELSASMTVAVTS